MSITYPLALPTTIGFATIELQAVNAVALSESPFSYKQQVLNYSGQRWVASVTLPPLRRDFMAPWKAFLTALKGQTGTFLLGDPDYACARGAVGTATTWFLGGGAWVDAGLWDDDIAYDYVPPPGSVTASPVANGAAAAGATEINVRGFTPLVDSVFLAGDYIQIGYGSDARLYHVLLNADSDASGETTLHIWPDLRLPLADDDPIIVDNPQGVFRLSSNVSSWSINNVNAYGISFEAVEAIT